MEEDLVVKVQFDVLPVVAFSLELLEEARSVEQVQLYLGEEEVDAWEA